MSIPELAGINDFVKNINKGINRQGISRHELSMLDHVCYRVETLARYNEMRQKIGEKAILLDESEVSGRLIATFEFQNPLEIDGWSIPYLELPQPKTGSPYPEGLEHAEFVVVGSLDRFARAHPDLPFDDKGLVKTINPELALKYSGISVKFHEQQLGAVVRIEQGLARRAQ